MHFGLAHTQHALAHDPSLYGRLETAVRRRAATLHNAGGVPAPLQDSLTILAARGAAPAAVARGTLHEQRVKRLLSGGFTPEQAQAISDLHTPNFM